MKEILQHQKKLCFINFMMQMHGRDEKITSEEMENIFLQSPDAEPVNELKDGFCEHKWQDVTIDWWTTKATCKCGEIL